MTTLSLEKQHANVIRQQCCVRPRVAIVLGTGLGDLANHIAADFVLPYDQLESFPLSTALGHQGQFVCGHLAGVPVIAMRGRCHLYEGYSYDQVTHPVRVMRELGATTLIVSNASGGMNPQFKSGDLMAIEGHVNLMGRHGIARTRAVGQPIGGRTNDSPYDSSLIDWAQSVARRENVVCHRGVYVAVSGPNYETRAEYRFFRKIGDAVGMSTVPEALTAAACGMSVLALSTITNVAKPDAPQLVDANDVVDIAEHAEPRLRKIVIGVLKRLAMDVV
ncbi:MAG: purine-nucleoside phosphorylase [Pirellulaceae bacterium]|nr:purine-nucleoside phosphorylase [Pirellulaceae bacterium]